MAVERLSPANVPSFTFPNRSTTTTSFSTSVSITQEFCPPTHPAALPCSSTTACKSGRCGTKYAVTTHTTVGSADVAVDQDSSSTHRLDVSTTVGAIQISKG